MALNFGGDLWNNGLFKLSPEENQSKVNQGSKEIYEIKENGVIENFDGTSVNSVLWDEYDASTGSISVASGKCTLATGNSNGGTAELTGNYKFILDNYNSCTLEVWVKRITAATGGDSTENFIGFNDEGFSGSYIYWRNVNQNNNVWQPIQSVDSVAGIETGTARTISYGNEVRLKIVISKNNIKYHINDVLMETLTKIEDTTVSYSPYLHTKCQFNLKYTNLIISKIRMDYSIV